MIICNIFITYHSYMIAEGIHRFIDVNYILMKQDILDLVSNSLKTGLKDYYVAMNYIEKHMSSGH